MKSVKEREKTCLIQEWYLPDEWKHFICCIFLNQTTWIQVEKILDDFFYICPNPKLLLQCKKETIIKIIRPLGLYNRRLNTITKFSQDWISKKYYNECYGIGKYASDSYKILVEGNLNTDVKDHALNWKLKMLKI